MFEIYKDNLGPSISDVISIGGVAQDLDSATVTFRMRAEDSSDLVVDASADVVDAYSGTVRYDWQAPDTSTPGDFLGWWVVSLPGAEPQDTAEFPIRVLDHAPDVALCTLLDVRQFMEWQDVDRSRDDLARMLIRSASERIMEHTGREFMPRTKDEARRFIFNPATISRFPGTGSPAYFVPFAQGRKGDLAKVTSVTLDPETESPRVLAAEAYMLRPNGAPEGVYTHMYLNPILTPFSYSTTYLYWGFGYVEVVGDWGFPAVPQSVRETCWKVVGAWLRRDIGDMGASMASGAMSPSLPASLDLPSFAQRALRRWQRTVAP